MDTVNTFCRPLDNSDQEYRKIRSVHANFLCGILLLAVLVPPFGLTANEHSDKPDELQQTVERQNQVQTSLAQQDIDGTTDSSSEGQQGFLHTMFMPIFGVLLLGILILLIIIFRMDRSFRKRVDNRLSQLEKDNRLGYREQKVNALSESPINRRSQTFEGTADYSKDILSDFKRLLEILIDEDRNIQRSLERIANTLETHSLSQAENYTNPSVENTATSTDSQEITAHSQDFQNEHEEPLPQALQTFCNIYNRRNEDQLQMNYHSYSQIGVINTLKRREDSNESPIFETNERGEFWGFYIEDEGQYAVVPIYSFTLEHSVYRAGRFGEVFECPDFNYHSRYKNLKIIKPAICEFDSIQKQWTLIEKGKIDLESSE
ncbi:MAG: hypothetical protein OXU23_06400 [Candidatus Poribacteria bacterium]|nr:hypothetical protein [Candidatus Poribacteria bacterium]